MAATNPQVQEILQKLRNFQIDPVFGGGLPDTTAPIIQLLNTPLPSATVGSPYSFTLRITDAVGVDESTITASAFEIRRPDNATVAKTITGITGGATQKDVAIQTTPGVSGAFTIALLPSLIADTAGNTAAATALGGFTANVASGLANLPAGAKVIVFSSGQSNWDGVEPYTGTYPSFNTLHWNSSTQDFVWLNPALGYRSNSNPTISLAKEFERLWPDLRLYVIEDGQGNNGFETGFAPGAALRNRIVAHLSSGFNAALALDGDVYFAGMIWNQGESDASSTQTEQNYTSLLNSFRTEIETETQPIPNWISVRIHQNAALNSTGLAAVRSALQNYGSDFVNVDDIPLAADSVHYTQEGYAEIGIRQFEKLFQFPAAKLDNVPPTIPPDPPEPTHLEVEVTTTAPNETYSWQISAGTAINAATEWGDGTTSTHTAAGIYSKTYAEAGVYTLRIQASFGTGGAFNMRPSTDRTRLTRLLGGIPAFPGLTSLENCFSECTGLTGQIPTDLLRYVTGVTNLTAFFSTCSGLVGSMPVDFLRYVTAVTNFSFFMNGCRRVTQSEDIFGLNPENRFLNQSVNFTDAFSNLGNLPGIPQGTAPAMWTYNYGTGVPIRIRAFNQNSASLTNWASIPAAWGGPA